MVADVSTAAVSKMGRLPWFEDISMTPFWLGLWSGVRESPRWSTPWSVPRWTRPLTQHHRAQACGGVLDPPDAQVVLVDTPGVHKPRTPPGERMNDAASSSLSDVDVVVAMVEATVAVGPGHRCAGPGRRARCGGGGAGLEVEATRNRRRSWWWSTRSDRVGGRRVLTLNAASGVRAI